MTIQQILTKFWGYSHFREQQEEIIESILEGKDSLALLPTGGGKSICFQVPALAKEGICIVVSPLIALMKDQVANLQARGIPALSITSGMNSREIDITLDNAAYGNYKFLYVSPERIQTPLFLERLKKMNVNLIAVDEAHCISQWGYDFRPSYLKIAEIRELLPNTPLLALTASATAEVVDDIQEKLRFKSKNVIRKSFERPNLAYVVLREENKIKRALKVIQNVGGTGIVYVKNRRKTKEVAEILQEQGIIADFYHAGLDHQTRDHKQQAWTAEKTQVIVSTNAFGMGIDMPHVRYVIHLDLPDTLEAYFQEAGRAGRDEKKAFAVVLYNEADLIDLNKRIELSFPGIDQIKRCYLALGNYFQVPVGGGKDETFDFNLVEFSKRYQFKQQAIVFNCINYLSKEGFISATEGFYNPSKIIITVSKDTLYRFQVKNTRFDLLIKLLLRSYAGLFDNFTKIDEKTLAKRLKIDTNQVIKLLEKLDEQEIIDYVPQHSSPQITFVTERLDEKNISISNENYTLRKKKAIEKSKAVWSYVSNDETCRNLQLLAYFGEQKSNRCGHCDVCLEINKTDLSELEFNTIQKEIKTVLEEKKIDMEILVDQISMHRKDKVIKVIQWMAEHHHLLLEENGDISLVE